MTLRLRITSQAQEDIDRNAKWWAEHHSPAQAITWSDIVYDQLEELRESALSWAKCPENGDFEEEIQQRWVGRGARPRHRAVFTIRGDEVTVLTIQAAQQDRLRPGDLDDIG